MRNNGLHDTPRHYSLMELNRMVRIAAENIARCRDGRPYLNAIDLTTGYRADKYAK